MSARKDFFSILTSSLAVVLAITIIIASNQTSTKTHFKNTQAQTQQSLQKNDFSEGEVIAEVEIQNAGEVEKEDIDAKTDLSKKIIQFVPGTSEQQRSALLESIKVESVESIDTNTVAVNLADDQIEEAEQILSKSSTVNNVETDYAVGLLLRPDWGVERIRADEVWETTTASGVRIAVIDTGIDGSHPDLSGKVTAQYDFYNNDAFANDDHGHGTFVSGVAAATQNNVGLIGVGPGASIMSAKVLGSDGYGYLSDVVEGINWAVENGASVINMSLGTTYDSFTLKNTVDRAAANGLVIVAAAGNTGDQMTFPAAYDSVIAVGATDSNDNLASFSARGSELVAPGVNITGPVPGGGYYTASGTSASSPHVAGVVAHMISNQVPRIRETLRQTAVDLGQEGRDFYFGYGLVDTPAALGLEDVGTELSVEITSPTDGEVVSGKFQRVLAEAFGDVSEMRLYVDDELIYDTDKDVLRWNWPLPSSGPNEYILRVEAENSLAEITTDQVAVTIAQSSNSNKPATSSAKRNNSSQKVQDRGQTLENSPSQQSSTKQDTNKPGTNNTSGNDDFEDTDTNTKQLPEQANENAQKGKGVKGISNDSPAVLLLYLFRQLLGL